MAVHTPPVGRRAESGDHAPASAPTTTPAASGGVITIGLFIVLFVVSAVLNKSVPQPDDPLHAVLDWRTAHASTARLSGVMFLLSALVFTAFAGWLAAVINRAGRFQDSVVVLAGGVFSSLGLLVTGVLQWVAERPETLQHEQALQLVHQTAFLFGGPIVVIGSTLLVVPGAAALLRARLLPTWLGVIGVVAGLVDLAAVASLLPQGTGLMALLPIGRFASMLWLLAVAVVVTRRQRANG